MPGSKAKRFGHLCVIAALAAMALALAACSGTKLYAPEGSIQKRLHGLDAMCRAYLFESGSLTLSEDFMDYAPQISRFCLNEARRLNKITVNPGEEFNQLDIDILEKAADALGELALAIEDALEIVDPADQQSRTEDSFAVEYGALNVIVKYIDERHQGISGSDALYR